MTLADADYRVERIFDEECTASPQEVAVQKLIDQIFNDHEAEIKELYFQITELKIMEEDAQQYALKCRNELEALQQRSCQSCRYGKTTINSVICGKNGTYKEADDCCKYFESKEK